MMVFKFGGASVRDADAIRNLAQILNDYHSEKLIIIISAMGKVTNQLESIISLYQQNDPTLNEALQEILKFHLTIANDLAIPEEDTVWDFIHAQIEEISKNLEQYKDEPLKQYDQVVSAGELFSTKIITSYLSHAHHPCKWLDARQYIKTDASFTEGQVNWPITLQRIKSIRFEEKIAITQGFIASTDDGLTTTLGREGSDYSAAIFASALALPSLTIWKDVDGVLNADPKKRSDAKLIPTLTYREAAEMTYYGAKVIHPKTMDPLARNNIRLVVRSFQNKKSRGTTISDASDPEELPIYILNLQQILITFSKREFAFMEEKNLEIIFRVLDRLMIKINMMQISATTFSICIDLKWHKYAAIRDQLGALFEITYNQGLSLLTIKNHNADIIAKEIDGKKVFLEQKTRRTYQALFEARESDATSV